MMASYAWEPWTFRDRESATVEGGALMGFEVHATDGHIGKVDEASMEVGASQVVVDTGPWIFGRKVLLPAACVERIDWDEEKVYVDRTKDQVKSSPELDEGSTWSLGKAEFDKVVEEHPEVLLPILKVVVARLRRAEAAAR